jgi:hypothetical protein
LGTFNHTGGDHNVSGDLIVGSQPAQIEPNSGQQRQGIYNFSGGNLTAMGNVIIGAGNGVDADQGFAGEPGGLGTFNQSGGTHLVGGELKIGQSGNVAGGMGLYTQSNGVLTVNGNTFIGGSGLPDGLVDGVGTFTQTGGTHTTIGDMNVGGGLGTYNLSGTGILNTGITYLNSDNGTSFNQSGGTHNTGFLNVYGGDYRFSGGTINVAGNMGVGGPFNSARFTQTGGDVFVNDTGFGLFVGGFDGTSNTGTYTLNTGTLTVVATTHVGSDAVGTFNQTGGTHTTSRLVLGENIGGNGTYNLSGGTLNDSAIIGDAGIGVMNTSGGTHNVNRRPHPGQSGERQRHLQFVIDRPGAGDRQYDRRRGRNRCIDHLRHRQFHRNGLRQAGFRAGLPGRAGPERLGLIEHQLHRDRSTAPGRRPGHRQRGADRHKQRHDRQPARRCAGRVDRHLYDGRRDADRAGWQRRCRRHAHRPGRQRYLHAERRRASTRPMSQIGGTNFGAGRRRQRAFTT